MMYSVYVVNGNTRTTMFNTSWLKVGEYAASTVIENPILTMEDNVSGSFTCSIPFKNQAYNSIVPMSTEIQICEVYRNRDGNAISESEIWRGRVIKAIYDFMNNLNITCEGILGYLQDVIHPHKKYARTLTPTEFFTRILSVHNSKCGTNKRFTLGYCQFDDWIDSGAISLNLVTNTDTSNDIYDDEANYRIVDYEDTLTIIENAMKDLDNPHLQVRRSGNTNYLDILADFEHGGTWGGIELENQEIRLGVNLLDLKKTNESTDICSVIVPLGARKENEKNHLGSEVALQPVFVGNYVGATLIPSGEENAGLAMGINDVNFQVKKRNVVPGTKYFYTGRQHNGYGMYTFLDSNGNVVESHFSETDPNGPMVTDLIETVIEVPTGANQILISGETSQVDLKLYSYLPNSDAEDRINISKVVDSNPNRHQKLNGEVYVVHDGLLEDYGWIEKVLIFENIYDDVTLYYRALSYFNEITSNDILEIKAIDLNTLDNSIPSLCVGASVHVVSAYHNVDDSYPITKIDLHLDDPSQSNITLSFTKKKTITSLFAQTYM